MSIPPGFARTPEPPYLLVVCSVPAFLISLSSL